MTYLLLVTSLYPYVGRNVNLTNHLSNSWFCSVVLYSNATSLPLLDKATAWAPHCFATPEEWAFAVAEAWLLLWRPPVSDCGGGMLSAWPLLLVSELAASLWLLMLQLLLQLLLLPLSLLSRALIFESWSNQNKFQEENRTQNLFIEFTEVPLMICKYVSDTVYVYLWGSWLLLKFWVCFPLFWMKTHSLKIIGLLPDVRSNLKKTPYNLWLAFTRW